jgi:predicted nucleic acid-binding protein
MWFERSGFRALGAERVVIDASVAIKASLVDGGFDLFASHSLAAPSLLWSEAAAGLRQLEWRGEISIDQGRLALDRLLAVTVMPHPSASLIDDALAIARRLGWAKTYDAEYLALARRLDTSLVTLDARLRRGGTSLVNVLGPTELGR